MMHRFEYWVDVQNGYKPVMETEEETEIRFIVEAKNRVTADRMVKVLLQPGNVVEWGGICVDD